ncbi:hypothetical protein TWF694_004444 [Orbilia ellipsospora]|uniref:Cupin type-1 domain-containing protein n=1 Tax=Orbilia ellipsospora TaxID=2528407 RepID=A0AAV9WXC6_9PEZI
MRFQASILALLASFAAADVAAPTPAPVPSSQGSIPETTPVPVPHKVGKRQEGLEQPEAYGDLEFIARLISAPLQADRVFLLRDEDFIFDFQNPPGDLNVETGDSGRIVVANRKTMPALIGTGSGMSVGFLGPCGFNTPHTHPRGTELNIPVVGNLNTSLILEDGSRVINNYIKTLQMHVFPQGAIHLEFNPDCTNAIFVAGFNNEDFGTSHIANNFFRLSDEVVAAAVDGNIVIDGRDIEQFRNRIPKSVAIGVEECLRKCNLL